MLNRYLHRLYDTIISRGYVEVERLDFDELPGRQGIIEGRLNSMMDHCSTLMKLFSYAANRS